jgi:hypothetical protein
VIQVESKLKSHHAEITSVILLNIANSNQLTYLQRYCTLTVRWTTHTPPGLSNKDIYMADFSDEWAGKIGAVASTEAPRCG